MTRPPKKPARLGARSADAHALYEIAVQRPEIMIGFIDELGEALMDRPPDRLREDFCGTANLAATWVAGGDQRTAVAVDIDPAVLDWAEQHNRRPLGDRADRLELACGDVMRIHSDPVDVRVSLNFSHFIYKQRNCLLDYFKAAHDALNSRGFMILDAFGGPGSISPCRDRRRFSRFDYWWEQVAFNPLTNEIDCRIHFSFPDGTRLDNAFCYDWRLWSLPELTELLEEAGFGEIAIYFESEEGYIADTDAIDLDAWVAYIVAAKGQ
jgi:SAM-dependent methyltransferase